MNINEAGSLILWVTLFPSLMIAFLMWKLFGTEHKMALKTQDMLEDYERRIFHLENRLIEYAEAVMQFSAVERGVARNEHEIARLID